MIEAVVAGIDDACRAERGALPAGIADPGYSSWKSC